METARVQINYRPLRLAWLLESNERDSFRKAVRRSCALWGGSFNPIILVDRPEADRLVTCFNPDFLVPIGTGDGVRTFLGRYKHLSTKHLHEWPLKDRTGGHSSAVLDILNLIAHCEEKPAWKQLVDAQFRIPSWDADDPLSDAFLIQYGVYPTPEEAGCDYHATVTSRTRSEALRLRNGERLPVELLNHPNIFDLTVFGLSASAPAWQVGHHNMGVFGGDAASIDDLTNFWNLRAAGHNLLFLDLQRQERFANILPTYEQRARDEFVAMAGHRKGSLLLWARPENIDALRQFVAPDNLVVSSLTEHSWNGSNIKPVNPVLCTASSLGVVSTTRRTPRLSFALNDRPYSSTFWRQMLVASIDVFELRDDSLDTFTFVPPFVPEINDFAARSMSLSLYGLRLERGRLGVVINTVDENVELNALSVSALIEAFFGLARLKSKLSSGGLITRQLISTMGGIDHARAFKIPGVRRLLRTHGPTSSFNRKSALQLIGSTDPKNPTAHFSDHKDLHIEPRDEADLTPAMVFSHLVERGLFRIGADLKCPTCSLRSWTPLEALREAVTCSLCGAEFDATRQLVEGDFAYRRTGLLGIEKNAQGAVPVALVLQQLYVTLSWNTRRSGFGASYDLEPQVPGGPFGKCETDLVVFQNSGDRIQLIIGECKDQGEIEDSDIENLRRVADAFPDHRFDVFILLAKLTAFSPEEIELASSLNTAFKRRVIMLTNRELEPQDVYERTEAELGTELSVGSPSRLADATHQIYFDRKE